LRFKQPTRCHLWQKVTLTRDDLDFESIIHFADESHFERSVVRCRRCGQLYLFQFYELVDWQNGNDTTFTIYVPIRQNDIERMRNISPLELIQSTPRLQYDGENLIWIGR
jgi:hypothetical protein